MIEYAIVSGNIGPFHREINQRAHEGWRIAFFNATTMEEGTVDVDVFHCVMVRDTRDGPLPIKATIGKGRPA